MKKIIAIIPARLQSTRLPMKLLKKIGNKSILQRTYESVLHTGLFDEVIVACDHELLEKEIKEIKGQVFRSLKDHESGSDRIAEAAANLEADIIVNVQGDEPFIQKQALEKVLSLFNKPEVEVASLITPIHLEEQWKNPNCVKVVVDKHMKALYFSRAPIPFRRDENQSVPAYKHIGLYAFTKKALFEFISFPPSPLELTEKLENLRMLENGMTIHMAIVEESGISIDTEEDLQLAMAYFEKFGEG